MLKMFCDLRAHELLGLRRILNVFGAKRVPLAWMWIKVDRSIKQFSLHCIQRLGLYRDH
jgi:hypothetical protein